MHLSPDPRRRQGPLCYDCRNGVTPDVVWEIHRLAPLADPGPTAHPPGTAERCAVYAKRVELGLPVFHEWDVGAR